MKSTLSFVLLAFTLIFAEKAHCRAIVEAAATGMSASYESTKDMVGVGYDNTAGPQLLCIQKLFSSWGQNYLTLTNSLASELQGSEPVAALKKKVETANTYISGYDQFVPGITSIVATAMVETGIVDDQSITALDPKTELFRNTIAQCKSSNFATSVQKLASASNVSLDPQSLQDPKFLNYLQNAKMHR